MPVDKDPRIITPIPTDLLVRIDDYRFTKRLPSRAEAIRRLIEAGLSTSEKGGTSDDGGAGGKSKPRATKPPSSPEKPKPAPRSAAPTTSLTKEAQLRALRESRA
jgi:hypothetical protein